MATVKIKFRPSTVDGGQGSIFYQVIHNRVARQQKTGYRLYGYEWNSHSSEVVLPKFNETRKRHLSEIGDKIRMDVKHFQKVIADFEHSGCDYGQLKGRNQNHDGRRTASLRFWAGKHE